MPELIIVIPAYNEEWVLGKVIRNPRKILYEEEECLLLAVDDGSTDRTVELRNPQVQTS